MNKFFEKLKKIVYNIGHIFDERTDLEDLSIEQIATQLGGGGETLKILKNGENPDLIGISQVQVKDLDFSENNTFLNLAGVRKIKVQNPEQMENNINSKECKKKDREGRE